MAKRVKSTVDYDHPVVVHRLMDGTVLDSIEGYVKLQSFIALYIYTRLCVGVPQVWGAYTAPTPWRAPPTHGAPKKERRRTKWNFSCR